MLLVMRLPRLLQAMMWAMQVSRRSLATEWVCVSHQARPMLPLPPPPPLAPLRETTVLCLLRRLVLLLLLCCGQH